MRALAAFLAAIFGSLLVAALLAWPAWLATHALVPEWQFHRVVSRLWQLLLLAGLLVALRRLGIRGRDDWGYGLPRPVFLRQAGVGLAIGIATMLPMTLAMAALGILRLRPEFSAVMLAEAVGAGLSAGFGAAVISPLGPIGIDMGYGFDRVDASGRPNPGWQLHFKLGNFF